MQLIAKHVTTTTMAQECILKCCQMGPEHCQYVWIAWKECYAVSCSANSNACQPVRVSSLAGFNSIYVGVTLSDSTSARGVSDLVREKVNDGDSANQPPVANAGPDVVIHFPVETSVTLDGTLSTDDKVSRTNQHRDRVG